LLNLLSNAVKFTTIGKVKFIVGYVRDFPDQSQPREDLDKIRFYIEDTGNGIPEDTLADIFLPFHQLDPHQLSQEGTGLGLTISQNLVEQMGSKIQVESVLNKGSVFWFDLDFSARNGDRHPVILDRHVDLDITGYKGQKRKILIVDDLDNNREVLVNFLTPIGFEIVEANSGKEAITLTQKHQPDLIILDLVMPKMDGWETTQRLRQESKFAQLPIFIVSASISPVDEANCYEAGANHFLTKPLNLAKLLQIMAQYLQLEWINSKGKKTDTQAKSLLFSTVTRSQSKVNNIPIAAPSPAKLNQLLALVMQGDIRQTLFQAEQLQNEPNLIPFAQKVIHLAQSCQLKKLKELIKQSL